MTATCGCGRCGADVPSQIQVDGPTPYLRCLAVDPPKSRSWKVDSLTIRSNDRELVVEGIRLPFRFVAFSGPAYSSVEVDRRLAEISKKKPAFGLLLGGVGDDQEIANRTLTALAKTAFPVFVLAGGRDSWSILNAAFSSLDSAARDRVIDINAMRSVRIGKEVFVPIAGAADGRYARNEKACGFGKRDLEQIAEALGEDESTRRWMLSWQLPAVDASGSVGRTSTGVDVGDSELGAFAKEITAPGGLYAWPYVQVMRAYSSMTGRRIPVGVPANDLHLVVPRLVGPAMEREDGSYVQAGFAVLQLSSRGIAVESP
jgi:hypothetical protein